MASLDQNPDGKKLRLAVITTSRADFGIYQPILQQLRKSGSLSFGLIVTGMHMSPAFGLTVDEVRRSGFEIWAAESSLLDGDDALSISTSSGQTTAVVARALASCRPDWVMVLGDRFEMMGATLAAYIFGASIIHLHGGEETTGSYDNGFRNAISKLSHLHFVATPGAARRLMQMGEAPDRVICSGAPAIDAMVRNPMPSREEFIGRVGLKNEPYLLVTFHAETLASYKIETGIESLWQALSETGFQVLITAANADTNGRKINEILSARSRVSERFVFVGSLGHEFYAAAMKYAVAMIGNSSSGIIEAAHFKLPVVNIGDRQKGRERSGNVIDCAWDIISVRSAIQVALSENFRMSISELVNVYGVGNAAPRIVAEIEKVKRPRDLLTKPFHLIGEC